MVPVVIPNDIDKVACILFFENIVHLDTLLRGLKIKGVQGLLDHFMKVEVARVKLELGILNFGKVQ